MSIHTLGELEQLILLATIQLGSDAYGTPIREAIEGAKGRDVSIGSLYKALERLQEKGFVNSELGESIPERGGRARFFYSVTAEGKKAAQSSLNAVRKLSLGLQVQ